MKNLAFRVDAGNHMGNGHLMRCLALAQAWQDTGGEAVFITACRNDNLLQKLKAEGFTVHLLPSEDSGWEEVRRIIAGYDNDWVVLDGYHFDETYQQGIKDDGYKLLVIDDRAHLGHYYADIILNQNLHAGQLRYTREPNAQLLMGTEYTLLRREFLAYKDNGREIPERANKILVTMGGSDPNNISLKVIQALGQVNVPGIEATVAVGVGNQNNGMLEKAVGESPVPVKVVNYANNMPGLMAEADVAVTAVGITLWEICFSGLPALVIAHSDYQRASLRAIEQEGVAVSLGWQQDVVAGEIAEGLRRMIASPELRRSMSCTQQRMVDGLGAKRVLGKLRG